MFLACSQIKNQTNDFNLITNSFADTTKLMHVCLQILMKRVLKVLVKKGQVIKN